MELSFFERFFAGQIRVADEIEVRVVGAPREWARQALHANSKTPRLAVEVRAFEAEHDEGGPVGREDHSSGPRNSSASSWSSFVGAQSNVVRLSRDAFSGPMRLPRMSVATPPISESRSRLAAMSKTRTGIGAPKTPDPPVAVG